MLRFNKIRTQTRFVFREEETGKFGLSKALFIMQIVSLKLVYVNEIEKKFQPHTQPRFEVSLIVMVLFPDNEALKEEEILQV